MKLWMSAFAVGKVSDVNLRAATRHTHYVVDPPTAGVAVDNDYGAILELARDPGPELVKFFGHQRGLRVVVDDALGRLVFTIDLPTAAVEHGPAGVVTITRSA